MRLCYLGWWRGIEVVTNWKKLLEKVACLSLLWTIWTHALENIGNSQAWARLSFPTSMNLGCSAYLLLPAQSTKSTKSTKSTNQNSRNLRHGNVSETFLLAFISRESVKWNSCVFVSVWTDDGKPHFGDPWISMNWTVDHSATWDHAIQPKHSSSGGMHWSREFQQCSLTPFEEFGQYTIARRNQADWS